MTRRSAASLAIPIAFGCVYFFWGSTYTAIKVGVQYLHPLVLGGVRFLIAGTLMLAFCRLRGIHIWLPWRQLGWLAVVGLLLLGGGNIGLVFSERYIASGLAALLVAVMPLYVAILSMLLPRGERLQARGWLGLALGLVGLIALLAPGLHQQGQGQNGQVLGSVIVLSAAFLWAVGSILSRELKLPVNPMVAAGWQMLAAGTASSVAAFVVSGWHQAHWTRSAAGAVGYLVTFGSLVGYTAFVWLLDHVPVPKVATYAYVNPVVAVILGGIFLGERMVSTEYAGMIAIVIAVALVTSSRIRVEDQSRKPAVAERQPVKA
ncbi:EamA family transporter [Alloacidobacterium dinghuense]|uniref:EamA family transporter n=1 Tax=Alloacidobacterium dinghuense TaxID=2763107 RepID=A0A7G8BII9_9BACT|nr:EamA family transporter [Alloacidobacterium dinghuense]QNI32359.1 EamA family transporter [Alloacidobacterium dinghuense]